MWRFNRPIRHRLPEPHWPTAEEAERSPLFKPISLGPASLETRTWVPAMVPWRATDEGFVTQNILDWYARFAAGQPGAIVVEATGIRDVPSGPLLRIGHDRFIPGLRNLVSAVKRESGGHTRLFIQLIDFLAVRRRPVRETYFQRYLTVSTRHRERLAEITGDSCWIGAEETVVRAYLATAGEATLDLVLDVRELESLRFGYRERVSDTHLKHVAALPGELPEAFALAAERARVAGFDGVELHFAHAYTMAGFLSATNTRADGYGGARENRVRLPLEVYRAVRARVGDDYTVGVRFLGDEVIEGGNRIEDAVYFGVEFARAGFNYLSISKGGKFEDAEQPKVGEAVYPYTGKSGYECMPTVHSDAAGPFGRNVPLAAEIKRAVNCAGYATPIVAAGGISTVKLAELILERGEADIIAAARQSLADPDWFLKARLGRGREIRRCEYTNYCEALDQRHQQVTCKLWDREYESGVARSHDGMRQLVAPRWDKLVDIAAANTSKVSEKPRT